MRLQGGAATSFPSSSSDKRLRTGLPCSALLGPLAATRPIPCLRPLHLLHALPHGPAGARLSRRLVRPSPARVRVHTVPLGLRGAARGAKEGVSARTPPQRKPRRSTAVSGPPWPHGRQCAAVGVASPGTRIRRRSTSEKRDGGDSSAGRSWGHRAPTARTHHGHSAHGDHGKGDTKHECDPLAAPHPHKGTLWRRRGDSLTLAGSILLLTSAVAFMRA